MRLGFKQKIMVIFFIITIIAVIVAVIVINALNTTITGLRKITQNAYPEIVLLEKINVTWRSALNSKYLLANYNIDFSTRQDVTIDINYQLESLMDLWNRYEEKEISEEIQNIWRNFNKIYTDWQIITLQYLNLNSQYTKTLSQEKVVSLSNQMVGLYIKSLPLQNRLSNKIKNIIEIKESQIQVLKEETNLTVNKMKIVIWVSIFSGSLFALLLGLFIANKIANNIKCITSKMQKVAQGDYSQKSFVKTNDEFEDLSDYFNQMTESLLQSKNKILTVNNQLFATVSKLEKTNKELNDKNIQLKEAQSQIIQSGKLSAIGTLAGGVAHEINNPLSAVLSYSILLKEKIDVLNNNEYKDLFLKYISAIISGGEKCKVIAEGLLDFSKESKSVFTETNLCEVLKKTLVLFNTQIKSKKINITLHLSDDDVLVTGNSNQLQQVFTNIILNAVQAMETGGELSISVYKKYNNMFPDFSSEYISVIEFNDNGIGMKDDVKDKIFEPFYTTNKNAGTGLGLSISYGIIQAHNGIITVESKYNEGTTFKLFFKSV